MWDDLETHINNFFEKNTLKDIIYRVGKNEQKEINRQQETHYKSLINNLLQKQNGIKDRIPFRNGAEADTWDTIYIIAWVANNRSCERKVVWVDPVLVNNIVLV